MSGFDRFIENTRAAEPLNRRFTSAAIGIGAGIVDASFGFWPGIVACIASGFVMDKYSHTKDDPNNYEGSKMDSSDWWKNFGFWAGAFLLSTSLLSSPEQEQNNDVLDPSGSLEQIQQDDAVQFGSNGTAPVVAYQPV